LLERQYALSAKELSAFEECIARREKREPLSHITNVREFWGRNFYVSKDVLDPRPDSETLIEAVLKCYPDKEQELSILELGVGSGCLLSTLLCELPKATAVGVDVSEGALKVARKNIEMHHLSERVVLQQSHWFESVKGKFDLVISNPPYISEQDYRELQPEVKNHEPQQALCAGQDGLECYREIAQKVENYLHGGAYLFLECGQGQSKEIRSIYEGVGLVFQRAYKDIAAIERVIEFKKR